MQKNATGEITIGEGEWDSNDNYHLPYLVKGGGGNSEEDVFHNDSGFYHYEEVGDDGRLINLYILQDDGKKITMNRYSIVY